MLAERGILIAAQPFRQRRAVVAWRQQAVRGTVEAGKAAALALGQDFRGTRGAVRRDHGKPQRHRLDQPIGERSEEHTAGLPALMRILYAVLCLEKKKNQNKQ